MPLHPSQMMFGRHGQPVLEIKPASPFVVLYGEHCSAEDAELKGKILLTLPDSISLRSISVTLSGVRKVSWNTVRNTKETYAYSQKRDFFKKSAQVFPLQAVTKGSMHKIAAGTHEWDFSIHLPGNAEESIEGLDSNFVIYNLTAIMDRGHFIKASHAKTHIRVIRTIRADAVTSMPMDQINEEIWKSKIAYRVTTPHKNYVVGSHITADFLLCPLKKGLVISAIKMELLESRRVFADLFGRRITDQAKDEQVAITEGKMPQNCEQLVPEGVENADELFDEAYRFQMTLQLPKSLKDCRQSVESEHIHIYHKLRIYVNLRNPEGHTSQLLVKNYVNLFISPQLPPNEDQTVVIDRDILEQAALDENSVNVPPTYGLHQFDELYDTIDTASFMTPGAGRSRINSGVNTPLLGHGHTSSAEDGHGVASAEVLQSRLANLHLRSREPSPLGHRMHPSVDDVLQSVSDAAHVHVDAPMYDMDALSRTPSYNTAMRTMTVTNAIPDVKLPSYATATSRSASPARSRGSRATTPSPTRSLDLETDRNTQINSQRPSPRVSLEARYSPPY